METVEIWVLGSWARWVVYVRAGCFIPVVTAHWVGGYAMPNALEKRKICCLCQELNPQYIPYTNWSNTSHYAKTLCLIHCCEDQFIFPLFSPHAFLVNTVWTYDYQPTCCVNLDAGKYLVFLSLHNLRLDFFQRHFWLQLILALQLHVFLSRSSYLWMYPWMKLMILPNCIPKNIFSIIAWRWLYKEAETCRWFIISYIIKVVLDRKLVLLLISVYLLPEKHISCTSTQYGHFLSILFPNCECLNSSGRHENHNLKEQATLLEI